MTNREGVELLELRLEKKEETIKELNAILERSGSIQERERNIEIKERNMRALKKEVN